ncbi:MAG: lipid-transfer protein [Herbiconiux sp.]|uniref:thiolase C-terminal domain-containing protein n=1 Tax=Herbiconiux sp. TaxID=1871186 RepID=UPI0012050A0C|nr:beta-ketoacyl synthase N-terminal-like domain-containing protein [Herbiconiux sp.]TAJ49467.1 MAG: lipid-transfer protein [Herbiconiux sp.]
MSERVFVVGVGMTKFEKPGRPTEHEAPWDYPSMAHEAGTAALADARIRFDDVQLAVASYVYGDSTSGTRAVYELGETGIPVLNVNSNCSSGSNALYLARQLLRSGETDVALALGFEKMQRGSLSEGYADRESPLRRIRESVEARYPSSGMPMTLEIFGAAGLEHMERYGTTAEQFGRVAEKNHRHSRDNARSQFRDVYSLDEIMDSPGYYGPLTKLMCSPTSDGAAAAILMTERGVERYGLAAQAVEIVGQALVTDQPDSFDGSSAIAASGAGLTQRAARQVYDATGYGPEDVDVIELHDCFATNELISYEGLGLCGAGQGGALIDSGDATYGGRWVINPSGGLIAKGHPLGATGIAQCAELTWQLRGLAGERQVDGAARALQHNIGLGGSAVVSMYAAPAA